MKSIKLAIAAGVLVLGGLAAQGQTYSEYKFIFYGNAYRTNAAGVLVGTPMTDQTLLRSRAAQGGITNLNSVEMVYHINGNSLGDTVDIVSIKDGSVLTTEFGFYFGLDGALGRTVAGTTTSGQRRVDYIYTFDNSPYTFANSDSVGAAFTYKHFVKGAKGVTNAVINGTMSWSVTPTGTNTVPVLCVGTFSIGKALR